VKRRDIPNVLTFLRFGLTVPVVYLLLAREFSSALLLFAAAGVSDGLDGYLAKRYHWESRLGSMLDPLADKALLVSSFLCLGWLGVLPGWLVAAVLLRDLVIVAGAVYYHFRVEPLVAAPSLISKLNTLVQIMLVILAVCDAGPLPLPDLLISGLIWGTLATTLLSGADYVVVWYQRARRRGWLG
jgi:cardiolipin synthase